MSAPDAVARALAGDVDDRPGAARCASCGRRPASPCSSTAPSPSARSPSHRPESTTSRSPARSGSAGRTRRVRSSSRSRTPEGLGPSYFAQAEYEPDGQFQPKAGLPGSTPTGGRRRRSRACWRRSTSARPGRSIMLPRSPSAAGSCSPRRCEVIVTRPRASARPSSHSGPTSEPAALVDALCRARACTCARSRAPDSIRVSCGWWTSDGDLDRLARRRCRHDPRRAGVRCGAVRLRDRRPRARCDRLPLRGVPGRDRRAVGRGGRLPARPRRRDEAA